MKKNFEVLIELEKLLTIKKPIFEKKKGLLKDKFFLVTAK